jgi:hypothetical protein
MIDLKREHFAFDMFGWINGVLVWLKVMLGGVDESSGSIERIGRGK